MDGPGLTPLAGGFSGETFLAESAGERLASGSTPGAGPAAGLFALIELAGRRGENPVADRAEVLLRAVAASGDLHAVA